MEFLRIYTPVVFNEDGDTVIKTMVRKGEYAAFASLRWDNISNDAGEFEAHFKFDKDVYSGIELFDIAELVRDGTQAKERFAVVTSKSITAGEGKKEIVIIGKMVSYLLEYRPVLPEVGANGDSRDFAAEDNGGAGILSLLVANSYVNPTNTSGGRMLFGSAPIIDLSGVIFDSSYTAEQMQISPGGSVFEEFKNIIELHKLAFYGTIIYDEEHGKHKLKICVYTPSKNENVIFYSDSAKSFSFCESTNNLVNSITFGTGKGQGQRSGEQDIYAVERWFDVSDVDVSDCDVLWVAQNRQIRYCKKQVAENNKAEEMTLEVGRCSYEYLTDFNVGDKVAARIDEAEITAENIIVSGVSETWEQGHEISITLGTERVNVFRKIKRSVR